MIMQMAFAKVSSVGACSKCHRPLSNPISVQLGIGPVCRGHHDRNGSNDMDICKNDEFADETDFSINLREGLVLRRKLEFQNKDRVGGVVTNIPHLVTHHSPSGFEWGYGGSGPADLSLNICQLYLNITGYSGRKTKCFDGSCWELAWYLHQDFKRDFIAGVPRASSIVIPFETIDNWFQMRMTDALLAQCREWVEAEDQ